MPTVRDIAGLYAALAGAKPGDVIELADGEYVADDRLECAADGTEAQPITLRGSRKAVLRTKRGPDGELRAARHRRLVAARGVPRHAGEEGHRCGRRAARRDRRRGGRPHRPGGHPPPLRLLGRHGAGLRRARHGPTVPAVRRGHLRRLRGVDNWHATDGTGVPYGENNGAGPDRSDRALIEGNRIWNTTAEGIDVKEGTSAVSSAATGSTTAAGPGRTRRTRGST
jgi:hypothetical protein